MESENDPCKGQEVRPYPFDPGREGPQEAV